jgi:hypothetical protein
LSKIENCEIEQQRLYFCARKRLNCYEDDLAPTNLIVILCSGERCLTGRIGAIEAVDFAGFAVVEGR